MHNLHKIFNIHELCAVIIVMRIMLFEYIHYSDVSVAFR